MDAACYPHIFDTIVVAAATHYMYSSQGDPAALTLRGTCRAVFERFDSLLFRHIRLEADDVCTPTGRKIPELSFLEKWSSVRKAYWDSSYIRAMEEHRHWLHDRMDKYTRVLDLDALIDDNARYSHHFIEKLHLPGLETVRAARLHMALPSGAPTLLACVNSRDQQFAVSRLFIAPGTRVCKLSFDWAAPRIVFFKAPTMDELVFLYPHAYHYLCATTAEEADTHLLYLLRSFDLCLSAQLAHGARITFVGLEHLKATADILASMHRSLHWHLAADPKYKSQGCERHLVTLDPADELLKSNIALLSWDEWVAGATPLELEWLGPDSYRS